MNILLIASTINNLEFVSQYRRGILWPVNCDICFTVPLHKLSRKQSSQEPVLQNAEAKAANPGNMKEKFTFGNSLH
jgi:hypothetical protein